MMKKDTRLLQHFTKNVSQIYIGPRPVRLKKARLCVETVRIISLVSSIIINSLKIRTVKNEQGCVLKTKKKHLKALPVDDLRLIPATLAYELYDDPE